MSDFRVHKLPPYLLGGLAEAVMNARLSGKEVIDLSQVNPAEGAPAGSVESLVQAALLPQHHRYSASRGITRLRQSICERYAKVFGVKLEAESEALVTLGTKEGLAHLIWAITSPGDSILLPTPAYPVHRAAIVLGGAGLIGIPLREGEEYPQTLTAESEVFFTRLSKVYGATWPRPRVMILSFPHNPTAAVANASFFERLMGFAKEHCIYLIHDFAYADMCFHTYKAPSILSVAGAKDVAVEFYSLSKSYAMPGWRIGFCLGNRELVSALQKLKSYIDFGAFQPLQIAAVKAIESGDSHQQHLLSMYQMRGDVLVRGLKKLGFDCSEPKGSLFVWARIPERFRSLGSLGFAEWLLQETSVAVCPGEGFDEEASDFLRFSLVEPEERIAQALANMEGVLKT